VAERGPSEFPETDCSDGLKKVEREGSCEERRGRGQPMVVTLALRVSEELAPRSIRDEIIQ
jgi:hypothetical protein